MAIGRWENVVQEIRRVASLAGVASLPDRELLNAFVARQDQLAFEALLRRYGPMVFGVCRRILRHSQDAEDSFQATFLVLIRKASSLGPRAAVGSWLYGVAYRTALQARARSVRRRRREAEVPPLDSQDSTVETAARRELQALLDRELNRLPEKLRAPVLLCDLLGKTKRQAAEELRCPEGTVSSRLARGRKLLRKRLEHCRPDLGAMGGVVLAEQISTVAVPAGLCGATIKAVSLIAKGSMAAAGIAPGVASLVEGVVKTMFIAKLKPCLVLIAAAVLCGGVAWSVTHDLGADQDSGPVNQGQDTKAGTVVTRLDFVNGKQKREQLLYGDKDFNAWRDTLRNQLKPELRIEAIKAMAAFGVSGYAEEAAMAILQTAKGYFSFRKDDDDDRVLQSAQTALRKIGPPGFPAIAMILASKSVQDRRMGADTLGYLMDEYLDDAYPLFVRAFKDDDEQVHRIALRAIVDALPMTGFPASLSASDKSALIPVLLQDLKGKHEDSRIYAAVVIGWLGPQGRPAAPALVKALQDGLKDDNNLHFCGKAIQALCEVDKEAVKQITPMLIGVIKEDRGYWMSQWAVTTLGEIGPAAKDALPTLTALIERLTAQIENTPANPLNDARLLRQKTIEALEKIKG